jgi:hypothetical protein
MGFFSHDHRESVIKWHVSILRMLNMKDKTIGFYLRSLHVHTPIYLLIAMQTCSFPVAVFVLCCLFIALTYFVLYDGCVLSKIEKTLDGQDITIVDPFLEIRGVKKTKQNRMRLSYVFAAGYITLMLLIFWYRFYFT